MRVTRDILNYLKVTSIYIIKGSAIHACVPVDVDGDIWKISTDTGDLSGNALIRLRCDGKDYCFKVRVISESSADNFSFTYTVQLSDKKESNLFLLEFHVLEQKFRLWEKRKEERYDIGFDEEKIRRFRLKGFEQKVIVQKLTLPCVVHNVSFSGAKITTVDAHFSKERKVFLFLSFTSPIEQVLLPAYIRNLSLKDVGGQVAATLSLEFEDAPIAYKQRVADFINQKRIKKENENND